MTLSFSNFTAGPRNLITDVDGVLVGNAHDAHVRTGVTVILAPQRAVAGVDMRGGAPGTRETDALDPINLVDAVDAIVLSGGSVYGLDAASALTNWLGARGVGYRLGSSKISAPIVPSAVLFDLANGGDKSWGELPPYRALAIDACKTASDRFELGTQGAGFGALAGAYKGGLGSASIMAGNGLAIGALVAVNAVGSPVIPGSSCFWAAPFEINGEFGSRTQSEGTNLALGYPFENSKLSATSARGPLNTTIAVVATNANLTPAEAKRFAIMSQDGLARALRPSHTAYDGDTVFTLATGSHQLSADRVSEVAAIGALGADTLARAIARGVYEATTLGNFASYRDSHT